MAYTAGDGALYWDQEYRNGRTRWHRKHVHEPLVRHYKKLIPDRTVRRVLVTMCGMTIDMNWLADQGLQVVGVDIALQALAQFMKDSGREWTEQSAPKLGTEAKCFTVRR
ncbi:thiopurine S-methyltransferase-like [Elysia marginata]|uniref:Thiopurine S-methyltransferase-like n=1 Tax=Elysia marginata TaxID=1093978 RepID=A0AAV4I5M7_9GAST|nr:thiopurine S-methyltransferase-like [Elysia marginata]